MKSRRQQSVSRTTLQRLAISLFLLSTTPATVWAGAWTVPRNRWYAEYFYRVLESKTEFNAYRNTSRRAKTAIYRDIRNEWKLEYGLTDWWNVLASLPYISSHYRDDNVDLLRTGVGDIYLRTKLRALEDPLVTSVQFSWKIPGAYDPRKNPIGDGQFDFESRLQLSRSWVFRPYEARVPVRVSHAAPHPRRAAAARPGAKTRKEALRDAILVAQLYQRGMRLADAGQLAQARPWMRAVVETDPQHVEAWQWLFTRAIEVAEGSDTSSVRVMPVTAETVMPIITPPSLSSSTVLDTETRYAGTAFVNLEGGFTARNEDPANEFPLFVEAGFTPFKRLMLVGSIDSVLSVKSTHEDREDYAKWGIRAIVNVRGDGFASIFRTGGPTINLEAGFNDIFAGRNTTDGYEVFGKVGIFF